MSKIKVLCLGVLFVFASFGAKAQFSHLEQSVYLNFNLATAGFNDEITKVLGNEVIPMTRFNAGSNAGFGLGLGYRVSYRFDVGFGEVSPYIHADFQWNRVKGDLRDAYLDADNGSAPAYFNIPIFVGVNYRYQLTDIFTPFAEFALGPDFFMITKESGNVTTDPTIGDFKLRYKTTTNLAWQIGAGCYFGSHVSASLHYNGYGKHAIQYTNGTSLPAAVEALDVIDHKTVSRGIGLLSLRIGFHF